MTHIDAGRLVALLVAVVVVPTWVAGCGDSGEPSIGSADSGSGAGITGGSADADGADATGVDGTGADGTGAADAAVDEGDTLVASDVAGVQDAEAGDAALVDSVGADDGAGPAEEVTPPVEEPPLTLTAQYTELLCEAYCGDYGDNCGSFADFGANYLGCVEDCVDAGSDNAWWIAGWGCASVTCSATDCGVGEDEPPAEDDLCALACSALDLCDQLALSQLPEDEPDVCRVACTAGALAGADDEAGLECIVAALDPTCDQEQVNECFGGTTPPGVACPGYCAGHYDPTNNQFCSEDTLFRTVWPQIDDCIEACNGVGDGFDALTFVGCTQGGGCADPTKCTSIPDEDPAGCEGSCAEFIELCGALGPFTDPAICTAYCTGIVVNYGNAADPDAGPCIASLGTCPADVETHGGLFFSCLLPKDPTCADLCDRFWTCADPASSLATKSQCSIACAGGALGTTEETADVLACMVDVEDDCGAVTACVPAGPGQVDPLCASGCDKAGACSDAADTACYGDCQADLESGTTTVAELSCVIASPCEGIAACEGVGDPAVEECTNACTVAPDVCGTWDDGCTQVCAGIIAGFGLQAADAFCVVGALGEGCDFTNVGYECAGWEPPPVQWETDVLPLLQSKGCTNGYCHGGGAGGLNALTPESLIAGGDHGPAVVPCDSESSLILGKLSANPPFGERMPLGGAPLTEDQMDVIRDWIDQGATEVHDPGACEL